MEIFYRLSSYFALESFLSSQCFSGNTHERGISIPPDMFIFIRIEGKIAKMTKTIFRFCKTFHAMQYISLILFPV